MRFSFCTGNRYCKARGPSASALWAFAQDDGFVLVLFILLILFGQFAFAEKTITHKELVDKSRGMWLGQIIANYAGRSTEGRYSGSIPNPADSVPWVLKQTWDADDDTDIEYIAIDILETDGFDCTPGEIAEQWLKHIVFSGIYISNKQARYLMGDGFLPPLTGSRHYNMHWYSIDSQITTEVLGTVCPGLPQAAIDLTKKFASISNEGFPVHAAQFYSAIYSGAFFESDTAVLIETGLEAIPQSSRTHKVISDVKKWYTEDMADGVADWRSTRKKLYDNYQGAESNNRYYYWIESTVNTGATVLCLLYGEGDFKKTTQIGVLAGWDCDCNPATAAGIIGVIDGYSGLPGELTDPALCGDVYKNVYRPYLPDHNLTRPQYDTISNIASKIADLAAANIIRLGGYVTFEPEKTYHIPDRTAELVTDPEKPDPAGPSGLAGIALAAGISVSPSASVENFNANNDRGNLYGIIDGIKDNSYNGHKPYYTYLYDAGARPEEDYYQLNFSSEVIFSGVSFYEGDIDWKGINTYVRDDVLEGGFFEDIRVEVLSEGGFISPANVHVSEQPDKHKMYQVITFGFEPTVGTAIRIIGKAGGRKSYTTIMELEAHGELIVNMEYLRIFAEHWMGTPGEVPLDINADGIINLIDFAYLASKWNPSL